MPKRVRGGRERKKKKLLFRSIPTQPGIENYKKMAKKFKKLKTSIWLLFMTKRVGRGRERGKKKLSFRSVPTRPVIVNSKKMENKFKKLKNIIMTSFQAKMGRERLRKREKKNCSDHFLPDQE